MAESLWEPELGPEDLFETISQTLLNAVDRDAYSGWGAVVWLIEKVRPTLEDYEKQNRGCVVDHRQCSLTGQGHEEVAQGSHGLRQADSRAILLDRLCCVLVS